MVAEEIEQQRKVKEELKKKEVDQIPQGEVAQEGIDT
jgi:hypothetical protein